MPTERDTAETRRGRQRLLKELTANGTPDPVRLGGSNPTIRAVGHLFGRDLMPSRKAVDKAHRKALKGTRTAPPPKLKFGTF